MIRYVDYALKHISVNSKLSLAHRLIFDRKSCIYLSMIPKILLVNPPIYDFAAYDFWCKPYGMLTAAGFLRGKANFKLFDYLDRLHPLAIKQNQYKSDRWGRGRFCSEKIPNPKVLAEIPRYFRRFGLKHKTFEDFLKREQPSDFVFIQTTMTYWYPGVREVIEDIRRTWPKTKIVLGGNYATLCTDHAQKLEPDFLVEAGNLEPLWEYMAVEPDIEQPPLWEVYDKLNTAVLRLTDGCPFKCTYCSVPAVYGKFKPRPLEHSLTELELLIKRDVKNIAFYDDALLCNADVGLIPFLNEVLKRNIKVNFHTPNAINARFITKELADLMVRAGFKTFYIGFESICSQWQKLTGSKVFSDELERAVKFLIAAGADPKDITAYQIVGHPQSDTQQLEESMRFVNQLGIRGMLADFSPIPGTADGDYCRKWVDMDEPLMHNKTAFPIIVLGFDDISRLKDLQRKWNTKLT